MGGGHQAGPMWGSRRGCWAATTPCRTWCHALPRGAGLVAQLLPPRLLCFNHRRRFSPLGGDLILGRAGARLARLLCHCGRHARAGPTTRLCSEIIISVYIKEVQYACSLLFTCFVGHAPHGRRASHHLQPPMLRLAGTPGWHVPWVRTAEGAQIRSPAKPGRPRNAFWALDALLDPRSHCVKSSALVPMASLQSVTVRANFLGVAWRLGCGHGQRGPALAYMAPASPRFSAGPTLHVAGHAH